MKAAAFRRILPLFCLLAVPAALSAGPKRQSEQFSLALSAGVRQSEVGFAPDPVAATDSVKTASVQDYARLDSLLQGFYKVLEFAPLEDKCSEVDFLISTCTDSLTRQRVALSIFDHYRDSNLMGDESVAIYLYDNWFEPGKVKFQGQMDKMDAEMFVRFNRQSLIGCDAPRLTLRKPCGGKETVPKEGEVSVLFFYDTSCAKCRLTAELLPAALSDIDFRLQFYAINCGADRREWKRFRRSFRLDNKNVKLHHLWDPELDSDYPLKYSVIGTPRIYCIEPQGTIIGRRLEMDSLMEVLKIAGAIKSVYDRYGGIEAGE